MSFVPLTHVYNCYYYGWVMCFHKPRRPRICNPRPLVTIVLIKSLGHERHELFLIETFD